MGTAYLKLLSVALTFGLLTACGTDSDGSSGDDDVNSVVPQTGGTAGKMSLSPDPLYPGQPVVVSVEDGDLNSDAGARERVSIVVINATTGEEETIELEEVTYDSSSFRGTLPTTSSGGPSSGDGKLAVSPSDKLIGVYDDAAPAGPRTDSVTIRDTRRTVADTRDANAIVSLSPRTFMPGSPLTVVVYDFDVNRSSATRETVQVSFSNEATGEVESTTLSETGPDTGVFSASLDTTNASSDGSGNGRIAARLGQSIAVSYSEPSPTGNRGDSALASAASVGPTGQWPWALRACDGEPDVYWGDYESGVRSRDANRNGIPDVVDASGGAKHYWYDPGALGEAATAEGDPNRKSMGDTLQAAVQELSRNGGGTLAIIGLGADHPYILSEAVAGVETEMTDYASVSINGDVEICAVEDVAALKSTGPEDGRFIIGGSGNRIYKNIKFEGFKIYFHRRPGTLRISFQNVWHGNSQGECPMYGDNKNNNFDTMLRANTRSAAIATGGGSYEDPIGPKTHIEYVDFEMYDCNRYHHSMYWSPEGCFFSATNSIFRGQTGLEVFRQLCRAFVIENSYFANTLDWAGTVSGSSTLDHRSTSAGVWRNNHIRVMTSGNRGAYAVAGRSRRDNTGSGMPNQWPGRDAATDNFAGNDNWSVDTCDYKIDGIAQPCPALTALLTAPPNTDAWLHDGKIWDRSFWREVTSAPWRPDQRELTMSAATGYRLHETITGTATGASATIWKIEGNVFHVFLDTQEEFARGEATAGGGTGIVGSQRSVTARELAENEHLFMQYFSGNLFEAKCVGEECKKLYPFINYGTLPGTSQLGGFANNRYYIVPLDTDPDRHPHDGYDTEATPGDGWVERVMVMGINNSYIGDWHGGPDTRDVTTYQVNRYHDGEFDLQVNEARTPGPPAVDTHPDALTPENAPPHFNIDLGGSTDDRLALPSWWPQGSLSGVCNILQRRYGDDVTDPYDYHWWDEPGPETGHPEINHDGFPRGCP